MKRNMCMCIFHQNVIDYKQRGSDENKRWEHKFSENIYISATIYGLAIAFTIFDSLLQWYGRHFKTMF